MRAGWDGGPRDGPLRSPSRGFSLPEVLVALAIFGMAVVVAASFMSAQANAERRLAARQELLRLAEAALESVRAGVVPLEPRMFVDEQLVRTVVVHDPAVAIDVRKAPVPDLYEASVTVTGQLRGAEVVLRVDTMVWRP